MRLVETQVILLPPYSSQWPVSSEEGAPRQRRRAHGTCRTSYGDRSSNATRDLSSLLFVALRCPACWACSFARRVIDQLKAQVPVLSFARLSVDDGGRGGRGGRGGLLLRLQEPGHVHAMLQVPPCELLSSRRPTSHRPVPHVICAPQTARLLKSRPHPACILPDRPRSPAQSCT